MATVRDVLEARRNKDGIDPKIFEASKELEAASWGLWNPAQGETSDLSVFHKDNAPHNKVRVDVVTLGGNLGLFKPKPPKGVDLSTVDPDAHWVEFRNFHTPGHAGDTNLRNGILGTPVEGCYMTDVVKNFPTGNSGDLKRAIRKGEVHPIEHFLEPLQKEIKTLGIPDDALFIFLSPATRDIWEMLIDRLEGLVGEGTVAQETVDGLRKRHAINTERHYTGGGRYKGIMAKALQQQYPNV